jgi:hypothetical protein
MKTTELVLIPIKSSTLWVLFLSCPLCEVTEVTLRLTVSQ